MALRDRAAKVLLAGYTAVEIVRGVATELLSVGLSVAVELGGTPIAVEALVESGFLLVAFYVFTPEVFPAAVERRDDPGFRLLVAFVSVTIALPISLLLSRFGTVTVPYALVGWYLAAAMVVGLVAFATYFRLTQSEPLADPDGDLFAILLTRTDETASDHRRYVRQLDDRSAVGGGVVRVLSVLAGTATHLGPCLLFGVTAATLGSLFPLLELLVVVGLLLQAGSRVGVVDRSVPDVESRFYERLTAATRSVRGTASVVMIVVGVLLAVFLVLLWVRFGLRPWALANAVEAVTTALAPAPPNRSLADALVELTAAVGGVVAVPLASGYAVWYWLRTLRWVAALERADDTETPDVARPPGLLLAATGLTVGWFASATAYRFAWPVVPAFAAGWPPLALLAVRNVHRGRRRNEPTSEARWPLPVAFTAYAGGSTVALAATLDVRPSIVLGVVFPLWLYYLGALNERLTGVRGRLLRFCYGVSLFFAVFALRGPLGVSTALLALLAALVGLLTFGQVFAHVFEPPEDSE